MAFKNLMNPAIFILNMAEPRATLLVRVSSPLKVKLEEMAKRERRSLSKQVELLLERCLEVLDSEGPPDSAERRGHKRKS